MSQRIPLQRVLLPLATLAVTMIMVTGLVGAEPGPEAARFDTFTHPDGAKYFALSLRPPVEAPAPAAHDVVVLFDTSASQTGDFRAVAMETLDALLKSLAPGDRVQLIAVDLNAVPMSTGFAAPGSPELAAAVAKLQGRVPLGSTDMEKAMLGAVGAFGQAPANPRSVVYIGDGMSTANLLGTQQFASLVKTLVDNRIPVSSFAIGPRTDLQLMGALASQTGGMMIEERPNSPEQFAAQLASAADGAVYWPEKVTWPASFTEVFPKTAPPLRTDRDTVVIGVCKDSEPAAVQMTVDTSAGQKQLSWDVQAGPPSNDNNYLPQLVAQARTDGGLGLPLLGTTTLKQAQALVDSGAHNLTQLAQQALSTGALEDAKRLADAALAQDPQDPEARAVKHAAAKQLGQLGPAAGAAAPADLNMVGAAPAIQPGDAGDGAMVAGFKRDKDLRTSVLVADVQNTINNARKQMSTDPDGAIQALKLQLENVRRAPELDADVREQLSGSLQAALMAANRAQFEQEERDQALNVTLVAAKERKLLAENLARDQEKLKQLLERFNSLMDERRYELAEDGAAVEAQNLAPDNPVPVAATWDARLVGHWYNNRLLSVAKEKGFMGAMYQIEKSHIPFPDEPPIVYPDAETWGQLTARRKERYQSMDLASSGPAEKKISEQLKAPTTLEFIETPLQDVIDYLKDYHGIEIQVDKRALDDVGIGTDTPITKNLKGISLRSALRLLLRELDLTYVIQDEVLLITTPEEAESRLSTKVYPVADLVLPIRTPAMQGGFGGLGGMSGGMGGMGGGMGGGGMGGGGMGGFGGGGMGGMGGGGMGMFNLPPEVLKGILPAAGAGGFQAFSVKDEVPSQASTATATEKDAETAKVVVQLEALDSDKAIDDYFVAHKADSKPLRQTVHKALRQVIRDKIEVVRGKMAAADRSKKPDPTIRKDLGQIIALIQAALRHGEPQPWMYDGIGLAMQLDGRSPEEIERAVMSAMDFVTGPAQMLYIGLYLERIGLEKRALGIYRQASQIDSKLAEPYMLGMRLAQKLGDTDATRWATVGILSQAWPGDELAVWQTATHVADATLEQLAGEKKLKERDAFQKAIDQALIRDVVVRVKWAGNADFDLLVEEPSGTVCSSRNPRSTAGGVLLGDSSSPRLDRSDDGSTEIYVCPEGFAGTYRVCVRRVWGKAVADRVTVEVIQHFRDSKQQVVSETIPLTNDEAVVAFDLKQGRRKESLKEHEAANATVQQLAVHQQVLSQQLNALSDPRVVQSLAMARSNSGSVSGASYSPFVSGAVGYQPVIITLPEGANFTVTGVVSADRRYVRVTCVPLFSRITDVRIFNFVAGEESQGNIPNTGGGGFSGGGNSGF